MFGIYTFRVEVDMKLVMTTYVRLELRREFVRLLELLFCFGKEAVMLVPRTSFQEIVTYSTYICCHTYPLVDSVVSSRVDVPTRLADDGDVALIVDFVGILAQKYTCAQKSRHNLAKNQLVRADLVRDDQTDHHVFRLVPSDIHACRSG